MFSQDVIEAAKEIGKYYESRWACLEDVEERIKDLRISKIEIVKVVKIHTSRPGVVIGARGQNVAELEKLLCCKVEIIDDEDDLLNYLIPQEEFDDDDYE